MKNYEVYLARIARERMISEAIRRIRDAWTSKFLSYNILTDVQLDIELVGVAATIDAADAVLATDKAELQEYERSYFGEKRQDDLRWLAEQVKAMFATRLNGLTREKKRREIRKRKKLVSQQQKEERAASIKKLPVFIVECFWCEGTGVRQDEMAELTNNCGHCAAVGHFLLNEPPKAKSVLEAAYDQDEDGIFRVVEDPAGVRERRLRGPTRRRFLTNKEASVKIQQFPAGKRPAKKREIIVDDDS